MNIIAYCQQNRYVRLDKYTDLLTLIQCLDCHFIAVKFYLFKENGFIHENLGEH